MTCCRMSLLVALFATGVGCGDAEGTDAGFAMDAGGTDSGLEDAGGLDAGGPTDAGPDDAGATDAGPDDAGATDAGPTDAGSGDAGGPDAATTDAGCVVMATAAVVGDAFVGSGGCEGVASNAVIRAPAMLTAHNAAYCTTLSSCIVPSPPCPSEPTVDLATSMVLYVFGTSSGCSGEAHIDEVRDCGSHVEVDYRVLGIGGCAAIVNAWTSVSVNDRAGEVRFLLR